MNQTEVTDVPENFVDEFLELGNLLPGVSNFSEQNNLLDFEMNNVLPTSPSDNLLSPSLSFADAYTTESSLISSHDVYSETNSIDAVPNQHFCPLKIVEQPSHSSRFRYRSDFEAAPNRKGYLKTKTRSGIYSAPAISIPSVYRNPDNNYCILVTIASPLLNQPDQYVFHNYEIEEHLSPDRYDSLLRGLCYEVSESNPDGILLLRSLRIIKKRNSDLESTPIVELFTYGDNEKRYSSKDVSWNTIVLVCAAVRKVDETSWELVNGSVVYSEPLVEGSESNPTSPENNVNNNQISNNTQDSSRCRIYDYAPKYGFYAGNERMIVMLTKRPEVRKYGDITAHFIFEQANLDFNPVVEVTVKDCCALFLIPPFPSVENTINISVKVELRQRDRTIGSFNYIYISGHELCSTCIINSLSPDHVPVISNKRPRPEVLEDDREYDSVTVKKEPLPHSTGDDGCEELLSRMHKMFKLFYANDEIDRILNFSKTFIKHEPNIMFDAISKEDRVWIFKYLEKAKLEMLHCEDENGNTVFIHAVRHNLLKTIRILAENKHFKEIVTDTDSHKNTAFHLLAKNREQINLLDDLLNICREKQIDMKSIMEMLNHEMKTALQVSISQNNIEATKRLSPFLSIENRIRIPETGDNLIHLAVSCADLSMVKVLIEDRGLSQQGNETNFYMTPEKLAESLGKMDIADYLKEKYPVPQLQENESDSTDTEDENA